MAHIIADRIKETSTTTGTGAFTLAGAVANFRAFSIVCANADTVYYTIELGTTEWEVGLGTWGTGNILTRTTPLAGSAATPVSFSAGTKNVFLTHPATATASLKHANIWDLLQTFSADIIRDGAAATLRSIFFRTAGVTRWRVDANNTAESGSNAGSNFALTRFDDAGVSLGAPIFVNRATGVTLCSELALTTALAVTQGGTGATVAATGLANLGGAALSGPTFTGKVTLVAGTTTVAPLQFTSGANLTTPLAGVHEYDGTAFFRTADVTSGRTQDAAQNIFRLTANGSALGPTIADYFGANSSFPTVLNGVYEIEFCIYFLKSTAGTVTFTITNTQTYTNIAANYILDAVGGLATNAAQTGAGIVTTTTAAAALPASASLTNATNHRALIRAIVECGTAGNIRLRITSSAGTVTPLRGSMYKVRRLFAGNVGTFAA